MPFRKRGSLQNWDGLNKDYATRDWLRNSSGASPFGLTWRHRVFQWTTYASRSALKDSTSGHVLPEGLEVRPCPPRKSSKSGHVPPEELVFQMAEHLLGGAVVEAVSLARCAQRGSRSHGWRCFRFCARRTGFIARDGPSVIGYWLALVMAGANNRAFWPFGDKVNDYSHVWGLAKTVRDSKSQTIVKNVQFPRAQRWFEGFLDLLVANNRSFCPRAAKTHDFSRSTIAKAGAPECPRGPKPTTIRGRV